MIENLRHVPPAAPEWRRISLVGAPRSCRSTLFVRASTCRRNETTQVAVHRFSIKMTGSENLPAGGRSVGRPAGQLRPPRDMQTSKPDVKYYRKSLQHMLSASAEPAKHTINKTSESKQSLQPRDMETSLLPSVTRCLRAPCTPYQKQTGVPCAHPSETRYTTQTCATKHGSRPHALMKASV